MTVRSPSNANKISLPKICKPVVVSISRSAKEALAAVLKAASKWWLPDIEESWRNGVLNIGIQQAYTSLQGRWLIGHCIVLRRHYSVPVLGPEPSGKRTAI